MTGLEIWLAVALVLTMSLLGLLGWYVRKLLRKFLFISENLSDLVDVVENYQKHLKQVYNMETYYGDETIQYLMKHTSSLSEILEDYRDIYDIVEPLELIEENNDNDDNAEETSPTEKEKEEVPFPVSEENVFYAGARRRDS
jgi:hypothetical protein